MKGQSLDQLYRRYYSQLYLYAFSLCKNSHQAQELCSDVFYKALLSCWEDDGSPLYWLLRVCKNSYIDQWRRQQRRQDLPLEALPSPPEEDPLEQLLRREEQRELYEALLTLPPRSREALLLHYFQDLPLKEVAAILGLSPGGARTLLYRARLQLRQKLSPNTDRKDG